MVTFLHVKRPQIDWNDQWIQSPPKESIYFCIYSKLRGQMESTPYFSSSIPGFWALAFDASFYFLLVDTVWLYMIINIYAKTAFQTNAIIIVIEYRCTVTSGLDFSELFCFFLMLMTSCQKYWQQILSIWVWHMSWKGSGTKQKMYFFPGKVYAKWMNDVILGDIAAL